MLASNMLNNVCYVEASKEAVLVYLEDLARTLTIALQTINSVFVGQILSILKALSHANPAAVNNLKKENMKMNWFECWVIALQTNCIYLLSIEHGRFKRVCNFRLLN